MDHVAVLSPLQSSALGQSAMNGDPVGLSLLQCQIQAVQVKLENVRSMFGNRQSCFRKLLDKHVRPVQLVAPRPENPPRSKSPLFSPKHGEMLWNHGVFS